MKAVIIFESKTGNTEKIAKAVRDGFISGSGEVIYFGGGESIPEADIYFVGSWTDKGSCSKAGAEALSKLEGKEVCYFGTAGFGGDRAYYDKIASRVAEALGENSKLKSYFICQGKMPMAVRDRYVKMITENPEDKRLEVSIANFDEALSHPDENDLKNAFEWGKSLAK